MSSVKIVVASKNPVKINAVAKAFEKVFPSLTVEITGVSVKSGVSDQPNNDLEALKGAYNRAQNAVSLVKADFWVGIEGGVEDKDFGMEAFAWVVIKGKNGKLGQGKTGIFYLPSQVAALIRQGKELGEADDIVFGKTNSKQENGAIGILTDNIIDRTSYYAEAVIYALIPFKNSQLYN